MAFARRQSRRGKGSPDVCAAREVAYFTLNDIELSLAVLRVVRVNGRLRQTTTATFLEVLFLVVSIHAKKEKNGNTFCKLETGPGLD